MLTGGRSSRLIGGTGLKEGEIKMCLLAGLGLICLCAGRSPGLTGFSFGVNCIARKVCLVGSSGELLRYFIVEIGMQCFIKNMMDIFI